MRVPGSEPAGTYAIRDGQGYWELRWCDEVIGQRATVDAIVLLMQWHVNQCVIAESTRARTTFHAAAARSRRGNGALLAAPMESGKTTTVTGLLLAGWEYLSDEAVGVDPGGVMWAYPKPLTIDRGSWPLFPALRPQGAYVSSPSWLVPATTIGSAVAPSAPLRLVIFPAYRAGFATALEMLPASEAALLLSHSTFSFDENGARDLRCVARLARSVPAYRLAIGDLASAVRLIEELDERLEVAA